MKKLLVTLAALALASPAMAAFVQGAAAGGGGYPETTPAINVTAGDTIVVCIMGYTSSGLSMGPSSSQSDTFVSLGEVTTNWNLYLYYVKSAVGGSTTFSVWNSGGYIALSVLEFSGESSTSPVDQSNSGADGSAVTSHPGVSITTTKTEDLVSCGSSDGASPTSYTAGTGWTTSSSLYAITATANAYAQYQVGATAGSYSGAFTTGSATASDYFTVSLAPSSGSSAPPPQPSPFVLGAKLWRYQPLWQRTVSLEAMAH